MIKIIEDFISPEEQEALLSNLKPSRIKAGFARNKVLRYGSDLPYKPQKKLDIPAWLKPLCSLINKEWSTLGLDQQVDHVTINEYLEGQYIDWHIDSKGSGPIITVLSLDSRAYMGLRIPGSMRPEDIKPLYRLFPRSLLHMTDEERWDMEHCTFPAEAHRWSIVFRKGTNERV
jgi:alkylated DNA repair dioxygenase AlkB